MMVASGPGFALAPLYYKELEIDKSAFLAEARGNYDQVITLSPRALSDIAWWATNFHTCSRPMRTQQPSVFLTSDSSGHGWGGTYDTQSTGGQWSAVEQELYAGFLTLQSFCSHMSSVHIRLSMDNSTAVAYILHKGGKKT